MTGSGTFQHQRATRTALKDPDGALPLEMQERRTCHCFIALVIRQLQHHLFRAPTGEHDQPRKRPKGQLVQFESPPTHQLFEQFVVEHHGDRGRQIDDAARCRTLLTARDPMNRELVGERGAQCLLLLAQDTDEFVVHLYGIIAVLEHDRAEHGGVVGSVGRFPVELDLR